MQHKQLLGLTKGNKKSSRRPTRESPRTTDSFASAPSVVVEDLQCRHLQTLTCSFYFLLVLVMLLQLTPYPEPICCPESTCIKDFCGALSKTTSFLLSHIAQTNADAPASRKRFTLVPLPISHDPNM
jgi:hypothetical protein